MSSAQEGKYQNSSWILSLLSWPFKLDTEAPPPPSALQGRISSSPPSSRVSNGGHNEQYTAMRGIEEPDMEPTMADEEVETEAASTHDDVDVDNGSQSTLEYDTIDGDVAGERVFTEEEMEYYDNQQPLEFENSSKTSCKVEKETGASCYEHMQVKTWALTHSCTPAKFYRPTSVAEIQRIVKQAVLVNENLGKNSQDRRRKQTIRVIGAGHSPNDSAMSSDVLISLSRMNRIVAVDTRACTVEVESGITLKDLHEAVNYHGLAVQNLGSISEQSLAGALATGTHGTGIKFGIMATCVTKLEIVLGKGKVVVASNHKNKDLFKAALCGIGLMGVITKVELQCSRAFDICSFESPAKLEDVLKSLDERVASADHYRFFWFPHTDYAWEWRGYRTKPYVNRTSAHNLLSRAHKWMKEWLMWLLFTVFGFHIFQFMLWIGLFIPSIVPWINKLWRRVLFSWSRSSVGRSDHQFNFNCLFKQHVDEWSIPMENVPEALRRLRLIIDQVKYRVHFPIEVRFVDKDDIWLSPAYGRVSAFIGVIMYKPYGRDVNYRAYFDAFERLMTSLGGRPHWAKNFRFTEPDFARAYPKWRQFKRLRIWKDSHDVFVNDWAQRNVIGFDEEGNEVQPFIEDSSTVAKEHKVQCSKLAP